MDSQSPKRLKDRFTNICRTRHLSYSTEQSYWAWAARFVKHTRARSEFDLIENAEEKFSAFISSIAPNISPSTQAQAWNALVFLYRDVLNVSLGKIPNAMRAKRSARIRPVPVNHEDAVKLVESVSGIPGLCLRLIYGTGLRVSECLRLRLKDIDFAENQILIYDGKGGKDGIVPLPPKLADELKIVVRDREIDFLKDKAVGNHWVHLPGSLGKKYPKWHYQSDWQYLFASERFSKDPRTGSIGRHHLAPETLQQAMAAACRRLGIKKRFTPHSLRHAAARFAERSGTPISEIQQWLRHKDVETTMRYLGIGEQRMAKVVGPYG